MTKEEILSRCDVFLLDLDGTVYIDDVPIGEVKSTLSRLRQMGKKLVYLTNNSSKTRKAYEEKLKRIGLFCEGDYVYTSAMATISYLNENRLTQVCLLATKDVREEFLQGGIVCSENPKACVLAYDTELTFEKIKKFDFFLRRGVPFIATHPDDVCPCSDGSMPDVGSFLAMFEKSSRRRPDMVVGKPNRAMGEALERLFHVTPDKMCMIGDRMYTDIRFAGNNGMKSVLVLSGETTKGGMKNFPDKPDLVLPSVNELFG